MKLLFTSLCFLLYLNSFAQTNCDKCSLEKVKTIDAHLNHLTLQQTTEFMCTIDAFCKSNAEFSEWSNETLFKIIDRRPNLFFQALKSKKVNLETILRNIENPVHDTIDLQQIYDKLKTTSASQHLRRKLLEAVLKAAAKSGQQIRT